VARAFPPLGVTILVVYDERISRRVAYRLLSEEGYRVFEADGCDEAMDTLSQAGGRVDLMMIDAVMPVCDGVTLAGQVREQWPNIKMIFMSAHPAEILARQGLSTLTVPFLAKPYTRDELVTRVREVLERRGLPRTSGQISSEPS
jgi:two-component system cell cycle sensor histidine kinase/response regulator CckA